MANYQLHFKSSVINYYVFGSGEKALYCLHGYGEDGTSFNFLEKYLGDDYTLYAMDFPFHGATEWKERYPLTTEELLDIFTLISTQPVHSFSLLAYSMGGRIAMHLLQTVPKKIECVVLVAPDGLHQNIWYKLSTQSAFGNKLFKRTMNNPGLFFSVMNAAGKARILNKSIIKFVHHFLDDENERSLLYKRWTAMRLFKPHAATIKKVCAEHDVQLCFLFGRFDRIILSKRADVLRDSVNIHIEVIEAGHQLLKEKYASYIVPLLNS